MYVTSNENNSIVYRLRAEELDAFVSLHSWMTVIHGDCKAWNIFLGKGNSDKVLLIDMQWTGKGHPMQVQSMDLLIAYLLGMLYYLSVQALTIDGDKKSLAKILR